MARSHALQSADLRPAIGSERREATRLDPVVNQSPLPDLGHGNGGRMEGSGTFLSIKLDGPKPQKLLVTTHATHFGSPKSSIMTES